MANRIVQAVYDLKDNISGKLQEIGKAFGANRAESEKTAASIERDNKRTSNSFKQSADAIGALRANLGTIAAAATVAIGALKAIDFGASSLKQAAAVEDSLARVKALADSTGESFDLLSDQIDKSAIAANVSTTKAAEAAAALAEQGQSASEIFETLTPTILLAKDAQIEVAEAASIVDDALDLFGKSAGDSALLVDQLVAASKGSKEGLAGLATAVRTLGPDARELGIDFEHLTGLLGLFGQNGIDAGKAARGLRTIFQEMKDPASQFSQALSVLGDRSGNFSTAIETLRNAGARGRTALLSLDGAARTLVEFLLQQAPGAVDGFVRSLQNAGGTAEKTAKTIDDTLRGSFEGFTNALDRLGASLLKTSLAPLREELQKLSGQLTEFSQSPAFAKLQEEFATVFRNAVESFDKVVQDIDWNRLVDGATDAVGRIGAAAQTIGRDAAAIASAINGIATVIGKIDAASSSLSGGVQSVFGATAKTITEGVKLASEGVDAVTGKTSEFTKRVTELDTSAANLAKGGLKQFAEGAQQLAGVATDAAEKTGTLRATFENVQSGAESVSEATAVAVQGFDAVTGAVENAATALDILPELYGKDAAATNAAAEAHNAHAASLEAARKAVDDARKALVDLAKSGDTNADAFQKASKALEDAQAKLDALTGKTKEAVDAQTALANAFGALKIKTQDELKGAADAAQKNFEVIKTAFSNGKATIEEVRRAFEAYAKEQRAAAADSDEWRKAQVEDQLAVQASLVGLSDKFTQAGEAGKRSGEAMSEGLGEVKKSAEEAAQAVKGVAAAAIEQDRIGRAAAEHNAEWAKSVTGVIAPSVAATAALKLLNERLAQDANLQTVSLAEAKMLLEDLGPLAGAASGLIERRISELEEAARRAAETAQRMKDEADSLQDEIDQLQGNDTDIEDRRHERKLADLKAEAEASGKQNSAEYRHLIDLENQLHELKLKNIRKEKGDNGPPPGAGGLGRGGSPTGGGTPAPTPAPAPNNPPPAPAPAGHGSGAPSIHTTINVALLSGDQKAADQLADLLSRRIGKNIQAIANRSR